MTFFRESRLLPHRGDAEYHRFAGVLNVYAFWGRLRDAHRQLDNYPVSQRPSFGRRRRSL